MTREKLIRSGRKRELPPRAPATGKESSREGDTGALPVVGIGASAGGLEALEQFLRAVPPNSGLAFVVVQHLDPTHSSALVELLQRSTSLPIAEISDRMPVAPNHVYLIPPGADLSILRNVLHLFTPAEPRGQRLPIDFFFRSLAADGQHRSVGVILSGMGSDGMRGVRAIKEADGTVFVQSPESAKFDSMPRSAIATGMVDVVAPANDLPGRILEFVHGRPSLVPANAETASGSVGGLEKIIILMRTQIGQDFSQYKKSTLLRRIERRMGLHQIAALDDYVRYLRNNTQEVELLGKEFLIGVTGFFRDPEAWAQLKSEVLPGMIAAHTGNGPLRAWVAGCSTGEEAYSLAMIFQECLEQTKPRLDIRLQIFATDLNASAIAAARAGVFQANIAPDVSEERLHRFFTLGDGGYQIRKDIREAVIFAQQNACTDPPFTKLDLLLCRNLLIYLEAELQQRLIELFHFSLKSSGILMLGNSETVGAGRDLFVALGGKTRLYQRVDAGRDALRPDFPAYSPALLVQPAAGIGPRPKSAPPNLQSLTDQFLLQAYAPPSVLVNDGGDILYFSGKTEKYLELPTGKANLNLFSMARNGIDHVLSRKFHRAVLDRSSITVKGVKVKSDGRVRRVDITIRSFADAEALKGMTLVTFADDAKLERRPPTVESELDVNTQQELDRSSAAMMILRDEIQGMQQEFSATKEELQSTIEELQSTNEELSTSKEEMQSTNEELQSVNGELRMRLDELSRAGSDMSNLLNSTEIAVLFLDATMKVRRFSTQATELFKLIPGDVGRPLTDLASDLDYPGLVADARGVISNLKPKETEIAASGGRWFSVRILPYRTQDNRIDGVVIILLDISRAKMLETELREARDSLEFTVTGQAAELKQARAKRDAGR